MLINFFAADARFVGGSHPSCEDRLRRFKFFADLAWNASNRSGPKKFGLGVWTQLNVIGHRRDPQKAHPSWSETRLHGDFGGKLAIGEAVRVTWARDEEIKKGEERNLHVANWVFAQTTHVDAAKYGLACRVVFGR